MPTPCYGRYQAPDPPRALRQLHFYRGEPLRTVSHQPPLAVLDQSDLLAQGIYCSRIVPGARDVDQLGSCTANATVAALSVLLPPARFCELITGARQPVADQPRVYNDTRAAEEWAIRFYHLCTDQTGDPATEWPPTDVGSSGPFIVSECERLGLASGQAIAHGANSIISLLQTGPLLIGAPFLNDWETPDSSGFVDGDGSLATLESQIANGVAGGHETLIYAVEALRVTLTGQVIPESTVLRVRNSWGSSWGDSGDYLIHLSTVIALGSAADIRQLLA